jgi:hypothetical protein
VQEGNLVHERNFVEILFHDQIFRPLCHNMAKISFSQKGKTAWGKTGRVYLQKYLPNDFKPIN